MNGYDETLTAGEDFDLFRRIRKADSIRFLSGGIIYESPRRYRKFGYRGVVWSWFKNAVALCLYINPSPIHGNKSAEGEETIFTT